MVHKKIKKRKAIAKKRRRKALIRTTLRILFLIIIILLIIGGYLIFNKDVKKDEILEEQKSQENELEESVKEGEMKNNIKPIAFQEIVDEWGKEVGGNKSVVIYDLDLKRVVGVYNPKEKYNTASLYKLFVVYEGYRRVESGEWNGSEKVGATGHNIFECLSLAISESNSPCAETMWGMIGREELEDIVKNDYKITNSNISNLTSDVLDVLKMMIGFYRHSEIKDELLIKRMKESFLNQPITTYNWRQGLPSGFSEKADVYNKVGWEWDEKKKNWKVYHDAAIVDFREENRHFAVVIMTNWVSHLKVRELGTRIEETFYKQFNENM